MVDTTAEEETTTVTENIEDDNDAEVYLSAEVRRQRWQAKRPKIDHLTDGVTKLEDGTLLPLFDTGDRIVVDCCTDLLRGMPWLQTIVGRVRSIDDDTGLVTLYDEETDPRSPAVRYVSFRNPLFTFKLAPAKGNPFEPPPPPKKEAMPKDPNKKGRGRPKGSKNRPKDVIKAEKAARKSGKTA